MYRAEIVWLPWPLQLHLFCRPCTNLRATGPSTTNDDAIDSLTNEILNLFLLHNTVYGLHVHRILTDSR